MEVEFFRATLLPNLKELKKTPGVQLYRLLNDIHILLLYISPESKINSLEIIQKYYKHGGDVYIYPFTGLVQVTSNEFEDELKPGDLGVVKLDSNIYISNNNKTKYFGAYLFLIRPGVIEPTAGIIPITAPYSECGKCGEYEYFNIAGKITYLTPEEQDFIIPYLSMKTKGSSSFTYCIHLKGKEYYQSSIAGFDYDIIVFALDGSGYVVYGEKERAPLSKFDFVTIKSNHPFLITPFSSDRTIQLTCILICARNCESCIEYIETAPVLTS